jgi:hypothetical protein
LSRVLSRVLEEGRVVPSADEERKEVRGQRHDFIKEYYKMATMDLDRHLKGGWQAIAVLAGGAAILTAGHDGKIGLPIATTIALATAIWAALTVIDANYWSLRAIAFLANVEAVYFSKEDRRYFNPYMGHHPEFKLLNSLRYLLWLSLIFGAATLLDMLWEIITYYPTPGLVLAKLRVMNPLRFLFWGIPILSGLWGGLWIVASYRKRLGDYVKFSHESPGPGVCLAPAEQRHVTLQPLTGADAPLLETDTQDGTHRQLERLQHRLESCWQPAMAVSVLVTALYFVSFIGKVLCSK